MYKKKRGFYRHDEDSIAIVNIQASLGNQTEQGRFTVNVGRYIDRVVQSQ